MYSDLFCKVYNEFGWNYFPEAFGEQLLLGVKEEHVVLALEVMEDLPEVHVQIHPDCRDMLVGR